MKIMLFTNSPLAPTGYGGQAALMAKHIPSLGHDLHIVCNYGLQGTAIPFGERVMLHPSEPTGPMRDMGIKVAEDIVHPDLIISLFDPWAVKHLDEVRAPWVSWFPVDSVPPGRLSIEKLKSASGVIAMSRFGQMQLESVFGHPIEYIPLGIDTNLFDFTKQPAEIREQVGIPKNAFVVMMNGNNTGQPNRKAFVEAMTAFARFAEDKLDVFLYLHTVMTDIKQGTDLMVTKEVLGISPHQIGWANQSTYLAGQYSDQMLAAFYGSADVLLHPSMAEGFGLCMIEAMACGTPVIGANNTTMPELIGRGGGWLVDCDMTDYAAGRHYWRPNVDQIVQALNAAYREWKYNQRQWKERRFTARTRALAYDFETEILPVWSAYFKSEKWKPVPGQGVYLNE